VFCATPFVSVEGRVLRKIYLETIEGSFPLFSVELLFERLTVGMCSTGIDFQLGTNAADTNGSKSFKQMACEKRLHPSAGFAWQTTGLPVNGHFLTVGRRGFAGQPCRNAAYPQINSQNDPKKRSDITG